MKHASWSLIYTVHISILDYNQSVSSSCDGTVSLASEKIKFIFSVVEELIYSFPYDKFLNQSKIRIFADNKLIL